MTDPQIAAGSIDSTTDRKSPSEQTPLLALKQQPALEYEESHDKRTRLFNFLEAKTESGLAYEKLTIFLICVSAISFVASSLFVEKYNPGPLAEKCGPICDALWFGNDPDNALSGLNIGATSILEMVVVAIFSVDYILRFYTADLIDSKYKGMPGRVRFVFSFFSLVDLASTVPFYVDAFLLPNTDLAASNFLRMFRLLRMMKVEGRYDMALNLLDDVIFEQRGIIGTALFVGLTVWGVLSSFFYLTEKNNPDMIYCGAAPSSCFEGQDDVDTSLCGTDSWGFVDCSAAGCDNIDGKESCWNLYRSIVSASFWTLMELFGEYPLVDQHCTGGKVLGTFTAVFAVAVFALPSGIFGSGFEDQISRRREERQAAAVAQGEGSTGILNGNNSEISSVGDELDLHIIGDESTFRGRMFNFFHLQQTAASKSFDVFVNVMILATSLVFMIDTITESYITPFMHLAFNVFELLSVIVFTVEYALRVYSAGENPRYGGFHGRITYAKGFLPLVDFLSVAPYWIEVAISGHLITPYADKSAFATAVKCLRLLRLLRFEKYTKAFTTFDDVIRDNLDVLSVTAFSALLLWILFSAILYYTERDNPDTDMANYYKTVPHAMWITLLNLSGECPLAYYSARGKVVQGIIGLFATAVFGVPIGLLGAGFEDIVTNTNQDSPDDEQQENDLNETYSGRFGFQASCYRFVNGIGSLAATAFELLIYALIALTVSVGIIQTVPGYQDYLHQVEWVAAIIFTLEYTIRFIGSVADPEFSSGAILSRIRFVFSFYSIIDLLAILPFYLAYAMPGSWVDEHDEYLRMLRLLRLLKLDKYVPSITLVDDVFRLKKNALVVSCFAAGTLWILFAGLMYLVEYQDHSMDIDNLPLYGCYENCTMSNRYGSFLTSLPLTGIHLTGDFPVVEYNGYGRIVCFVMVITAIGVVSIPSGLVASGFAEIVQSRVKSRSNEQTDAHIAGDDWFDIRYRELEGKAPPLSAFGAAVDTLQTNINEYLNGTTNEVTGQKERTTTSQIGRFSFFLLIIANVVAVVMESIPEVDKYVGNDPGNFFDVFEALSVFFFSLEYILRLISARKSRLALYSPLIYATTFFGIVDFISVAPWYLQYFLAETGNLNGNEVQIFRIVRIFRILQLEDFIVAFSKLDNVWRASKDVLKATGLMALIIWVGSSALFFIFEQNNPNFRECDASVPLTLSNSDGLGCYDFGSTAACNDYYGTGMCEQVAFSDMPNTMFYVAVFLGGDWGFVDFTWQGKIVCMFLCIAGIALYSIPIGTLFDSFGAIIGLIDEDDDDEQNIDDEEVKQSNYLQYSRL